MQSAKAGLKRWKWEGLMLRWGLAFTHPSGKHKIAQSQTLGTNICTGICNIWHLHYWKSVRWEHKHRQTCSPECNLQRVLEDPTWLCLIWCTKNSKEELIFLSSHYNCTQLPQGALYVIIYSLKAGHVYYLTKIYVQIQYCSHIPNSIALCCVCIWGIDEWITMHRKLYDTH